MEPQAKIGLGLSVGGTVAGLLIVILALVGNTSYYSDFMREYQNFYNEYENDSLYDSYPDLDNFGDFLDESLNNGDPL